MKGIARRIAAWLLAALLLPAVWTQAAAVHAEEAAFSFTAEGFLPGYPEEEIRGWYSAKEKSWFLFLPACAGNAAALRLPPGTLLDGVPAGESAVIPAEDGECHTLLYGEKEYSLRCMRSRNVAAVFLHTERGSLEGLSAGKTARETGDALILDEGGTLLYSGALSEIRGHGNSTFRLPKKSWRVTLDRKAPLAGEEAEKGWILLANHFENSLIRNALVFEMAKYAGMRYTSAYRFCDLYANGEYTGSYMITQPVAVPLRDLESETRALNPRPPETYPAAGTPQAVPDSWKGYAVPDDPEDITGGYLFELELDGRYEEEAGGFCSKHGQAAVIRQPRYPSAGQAKYLLSLFNSLEDAIREPDGVDPASGKHYSEIIDVESFLLKILLEEIVKNHDGRRSSQYFYKDAGGRIYAGPVWDYDRSFGNFTEGSPRAKSGRYWQIINYTPARLYPRLFSREEVSGLAAKTYWQRFRPYLRMLTGEERISGLRSLTEWERFMSASAAMNFIRWPVFNAADRKIATGADYHENIEYIRRFVTQRVEWLDENWMD